MNEWNRSERSLETSVCVSLFSFLFSLSLSLSLSLLFLIHFISAFNLHVSSPLLLLLHEGEGAKNKKVKRRKSIDLQLGSIPLEFAVKVYALCLINSTLGGRETCEERTKNEPRKQITLLLGDITWAWGKRKRKRENNVLQHTHIHTCTIVNCDFSSVEPLSKIKSDFGENKRVKFIHYPLSHLLLCKLLLF